MAHTKTKFEKYFQETLDVGVTPELWQPARRLPLFLREGYTFYELDLLGNHCLIMADKEEEKSAATIRKHIEQLESKWEGALVIYACDRTNSDQRRRLIEQKIPFVVPGKQMYLPMLGVDLREHFRKMRRPSPTMSPSTQALFLFVLLDPKKNELYTPGYMGECLGYSRMTMTRAFDELQAEQLADVSREGRERLLRLNQPRRAMWDQAQPLLRSPVRRHYHIRRASDQQIGLVAGLTALAKYSMLAAPPTPEVAMTTVEWRDLDRKRVLKDAIAGDSDAMEVQIWNYDPTLFGNKVVVDRLSLFLSLRKMDDERVQLSLKEMMEDLSW